MGGLLGFGGGALRKDVWSNDLQVHQASVGYLAAFACVGIYAKPLRHGLRRALAHARNFGGAAERGDDFFVVHAIIKACFTTQMQAFLIARCVS